MRNKQNNCGFVLKFLQYIYIFLIYYFKTQTKLIHTQSYIDLLFMCGHKRYLTWVCVHVGFCVRVCMYVYIHTHLANTIPTVLLQQKYVMPFIAHIWFVF